jgi:hypothetical protein
VIVSLRPRSSAPVAGAQPRQHIHLVARSTQHETAPSTRRLSRARHGATGLLKLALLTAACTPCFADDVSDEVLNKAFYTYRAGAPKADGIAPGSVINKGNVEAAKAHLSSAMYEFIKKGEYEMQVGETFDFSTHAKYVEATRKNALNVKLDPNGTLKNYVAGRPFPQEPDLKDPAAGLKLAWNFQYGRVWGDLGCIEPFIWDYKSYDTGKVERSIVFDKFCFKRYAFRTVDEPTPEFTPNPSNLYRGIYVRVSAPQDLANTQLLIQKFKDDTKLSDAYLYLGFQRRVRRLATGQTTDAFLGSDLMIEDFEGYNGRISDMTWTYKGTKTLLLPFWDRAAVKSKGRQHKAAGEDGSVWEYTGFGGKAQCHQDAPFQLRTTYVIEATPKDSSHPVSKRVYYMDAQTAELPIVEIYDRKGELWKQFVIGWVHADRGADPVNKGKGADIGDTFSMIDVQAKHCTTGSFRGKVDAGLVHDGIFSVQNMRGGN